MINEQFCNLQFFRPGKVHITKQTLDLLDEDYRITHGTEEAQNDPFLKEREIETFLISPQFEDHNEVSCKFYDIIKSIKSLVDSIY